MSEAGNVEVRTYSRSRLVAMPQSSAEARLDVVIHCGLLRYLGVETDPRVRSARAERTTAG
jgi:hypothetical protein